MEGRGGGREGVDVGSGVVEEEATRRERERERARGEEGVAVMVGKVGGMYESGLEDMRPEGGVVWVRTRKGKSRTRSKSLSLEPGMGIGE